MTRSSFTAILLGGVLAGACSKPNPLFLDTWDVVTDSGSNAQTTLTAGSLEPTTVDPTLTATSDPPTTTTSTATSSSDATTTEPTPGTTTETTGDVFVCDGVGVDMDDCCTLTVEIEADTFFSDAIDGVAVGCALAGEPPPGYPMLACEHVSFGRAATVPLFNDNGQIGGAVTGVSMMVLRFRTKDGLLLSNAGPVPSEQITEIRAGVAAETEWGKLNALQFAVHGFDGGLTWVEGDNLVGAAACLDDKASFACRDCGEEVTKCDAPWGNPSKPVPDGVAPIGTVDAVLDAEMPGMLSLDMTPFGSPAEWIPKIVGGLVLLPRSSTYDGVPYEALVPYPGLKVHAREADVPDPLLKLKVCK